MKHLIVFYFAHITVNRSFYSFQNIVQRIVDDKILREYPYTFSLYCVSAIS